MPSSTGQETPPLDFERKLTSSIRRLRASSISHDQSPPTFRTPSYHYPHAHGRSPLGLHRLKSINRRSENHLTTDEAMWFLALPDKVRRQYFTREEQILLRAACEITLAYHPSYDSAFGERRPRLGTRSSSANSYSNSPINPDSDPDRVRELSEPLGSSDEEYQSRNVSFSTPPRRTQSVVSTGSPFPNGRPRIDSFATGHVNDATKKSKSSSSTAKYYLDPKMKFKIRQYLATSRGFDEILVYGFPTDDESPRGSVASPAHRLDEDFYSTEQTARRSSSFTHSEEDEVDEGPVTPGPDEVMTSGEWNFNESLSSFQNSGGPIRFQGREMTLRLTLTKPGLRSNEDVPNACHDEEEMQTFPEVVDPLALEELTFSDDVTGKNGAFAVSDDNGKGLKKLWKKLQRPSSLPTL